VAGKWALRRPLEDLSDISAPMRAVPADTLERFMYNDDVGRRARIEAATVFGSFLRE